MADSSVKSIESILFLFLHNGRLVPCVYGRWVPEYVTEATNAAV